MVPNVVFSAIRFYFIFHFYLYFHRFKTFRSCYNNYVNQLKHLYTDLVAEADSSNSSREQSLHTSNGHFQSQVKSLHFYDLVVQAEEVLD